MCPTPEHAGILPARRCAPLSRQTLAPVHIKISIHQKYELNVNPADMITGLSYIGTTAPLNLFMLTRVIEKSPEID